ncbi:hypothetical protein ACS0TY_031342 [Phlomoides rotata]
MDAEKEKSLPENDDDNNNNSSSCEIPLESKPDPDQDLSQDSAPDPDPNPETGDVKEEKDTGDGDAEDDQKDAGETNVEEEEEELPPSPFDLKKVSEEIDQYIATLSDESAPADSVPVLVERFGFLVETKTADYDSGDGPVRWSQLSEEDSASFLESITRVSSLLKALSCRFSSDQRYASSINLIGGVLQRAMSYVEEEFRSLLEDYKIKDCNETKTPKQSDEPEEEESVPEEDNYSPGYSDHTLSQLIRLSSAMIVGGHELECSQAFFAARRSALEDSLQKLGFEKYSIDDVQKMQWESLEKEIAAWIRTLKLCATHFSSEHKLCNAVFSDHPSLSETLFCNLSQGVIIQLLNFSGAVALTKRSSEKLFKFLDTYEALRDSLPTLDNLFPEKWMNEVKTEASIVKGRLGESIISIFAELESSIKADSGKTPFPGGAVHPLTRYSMNYLKLAGVYKETLEQVYKEHQKIERADSATGSDFNYSSSEAESAAVKQSPFQAQMIRLMDTLDHNLDGKSKLYKDNSLSSIFMMNNGRYIVQRVRGSEEMNSLMGDTWCRRKSTDLRQYHKVYQRETWGKLLSSLHPEGLMMNGKVVKPVLKERFKSFNSMFDEIHRTQSSWVVCDEQLQSELRVSISNMVIPAYRSFLARYAQVFTPGRQTEKYVKYQGEDIETYIDELFDGNAGKK